MSRLAGLVWWVFALVAILTGALAVALAVDLALVPQPSLSYEDSLASKLAADYSAEPDDLALLAPVEAGLAFDALTEYQDEAEVTLPPGPLETLEALASATATNTPTNTPPPTNTPTRTPTPTPTSTPTPTRRPTATPTVMPSPTPESGPGPTNTPGPGPTTPPGPGPTNTPLPPAPTPVSAISTPRP